MIRLFRLYISPRKTFFVLGEGILIYCAVLLSSFFLLGKDLGLEDLIEMIWYKALLVAIVTQISLYFNDLYEFRPTDTVTDVGYRLVQAIGITSIVLAIIYFIFPDMVVGRWIFFFSLILLIFFLVSWRFLYSIVIKKGLFAEKSLIIGSGELAGDIIRELKKRSDLSYNITSLVTNDSRSVIDNKFEELPVHYG